MHINNYYENLVFSDNKKINVSKVIDPDYSDKIHWHPFVEILLSTEDNNRVMVNFNNYVMNKDDMVIVYPGDLHMIENADENKFILVQFPIDLLITLNEFNVEFSVFYKNNFIRYSKDSSKICNMVQFIYEIARLYTSETLFKEGLMYSYLLRFFVDLGQICYKEKKEKMAENSKSANKSLRLMSEACIYISENCNKQITLEEVAKQVGFSKYHFSHMFKAYTNITFIDFLTIERVKRSESLIANPKVKIIDVAYEVGFSSISSFNRAFKKVKGMTPSEYKKALVNHNFVN
ncbi:MAG: AraC family transcriptional regulator [Lachnospiraceae bacterium]|jgi:AraC-like DNA-binding protein|nr:AraC family transcriptional regulator [Lachnospiraceae bacterium]